jgi:hypothetical protein
MPPCGVAPLRSLSIQFSFFTASFGLAIQYLAFTVTASLRSVDFLKKSEMNKSG